MRMNFLRAEWIKKDYFLNGSGYYQTIWTLSYPYYSCDIGHMKLPCQCSSVVVMVTLHSDLRFLLPDSLFNFLIRKEWKYLLYSWTWADELSLLYTRVESRVCFLLSLIDATALLRGMHCMLVSISDAKRNKNHSQFHLCVKWAFSALSLVIVVMSSYIAMHVFHDKNILNNGNKLSLHITDAFRKIISWRVRVKSATFQHFFTFD